METYFTSGLAIRQSDVAYSSFNHILVFGIQYLNSLHNHLHASTCPPVSTIQFETTAIIGNLDANISTGTININPQAAFAFFIQKGMLDSIFHRNLYQHGR